MFSGLLLGAKVQLDIAEIVARSVHLEHSNLHDGSEFILSGIETIKNEDLDLMYIFHLIPEGFIMVPADNQAVPVLAFGFDHPFVSSNMPENLLALMNQYKEELSVLIDNQADPSPDIAEKWDTYLSGNIQHNRDRCKPLDRCRV